MFHPPLFIYFDSPPFHLMCIYILLYHTLIHPYLYSIWFYGKINVLTYCFNLSFWFTPLNYFSSDCNLIHPSVISTEFFNHLGGETLCKPWYLPLILMIYLDNIIRKSYHVYSWWTKCCCRNIHIVWGLHIIQVSGTIMLYLLSYALTRCACVPPFYQVSGCLMWEGNRGWGYVGRGEYSGGGGCMSQKWNRGGGGGVYVVRVK